jgi:hypothetical protein
MTLFNDILYFILIANLVVLIISTGVNISKAEKHIWKDPMFKMVFLGTLGISSYLVYTIFDLIIQISLFTNQEIIEFVRDLIIIIIIGFLGIQGGKWLKIKLGGLIPLFILFVGFIYRIILELLNLSDDRILESLFLIPVVFCGLFGLYCTSKLIQNSLIIYPESRFRMIMGILQIFLALTGILLRVFIKESNTLIITLGTSLELSGWIILTAVFPKIPSYSEFRLKKGMIELHVISPETGINLNYQQFAQISRDDEVESRPNSDLVAGGLVGIKGMLSEISGEKGKLDHIKIGEKSLIWKQRKDALVLLLVDENLGAYYELLDEIVDEIEISNPDLANFTGDFRSLSISPIILKKFGIVENAELIRKATIFYRKQMNPGTLNKLSVIISSETVFEKLKISIDDIVRKASGKELRIDEKKPIIEIEPIFPGCICVPSKIRANVTEDYVSANFLITPFSSGRISNAKINLYHNNVLIDEIKTPTRVVKKTGPIISAACALTIPIFGPLFDRFYESIVSDKIPFYSTIGGMEGIYLIITAIIAGISGLFFYAKSPKNAKPIEVEIPELKEKI